MLPMRRKGELTIAQILREWLHQVALPADQVREGFASIDAAARALQRAPWGPRLRRDDRDYVVYSFRLSAHMRAAVAPGCII